MKRWHIAIIIILAVFVVAYFIRTNEQGSLGNIEVTDNLAFEEEGIVGEGTDFITQGLEAELSQENSDVGSGITEEQITKHNKQEDCWVVYEGKVYDITDYIPRHPGGEEKIARNCGTTTQFQEQFTKKHGTSKVSLLMKVGTFIGDFDIIGDAE